MLVTGHTGFKGAWLCLLLHRLGAHVCGLSSGLPSTPSLFELAGAGEGVERYELDIRDEEAVRGAMRQARPEVVLHLAAQPLVRRSVRDPLRTFDVNVMGTANLLEAVRLEGGEVRAVVVVTSDKCYENHERSRGDDGEPSGGDDGDRSGGNGESGERRTRFSEGDPLGGSDPYSSSKACAELVVAAYSRTFFSEDDAPAVGSARAGNVIGGGDWGEDRLVPDALRSLGELSGTPLKVRNPDAVRPWQHVLNPLCGYLVLGQALWDSPEFGGAWNFGPGQSDAKSVRWVLERIKELSGGGLRWEPDERSNPPEASWLALDSSKAERLLGWQPVWGLERTLQEVVSWHLEHRDGADPRELTLYQLERFLADAQV